MALAIGAASTALQAAPVIYNQPENLLGVIYSSETDTNPGGSGAFSRVYDNFSFAAGATVTDVHWVGGFFGGQEQNGAISSFNIQFWSDVGGVPGASLTSQNFGGNGGQSSPHGCAAGLTCFNYGVDLTTPFIAAPGVTYWVSIVGSQAFPPNWGLLAGTGGDAHARQDFFGVQANLDTDLAFSLTGDRGISGAPEPATLALLGAGLAGLGFLRRRKGD